MTTTPADRPGPRRRPRPLRHRVLASARPGRPGTSGPTGMPAWPAWSARAHLELMDRSGIDTAVLSVSSPGVSFGAPAAARRWPARSTRTAPGSYATTPDGSACSPAVAPRRRRRPRRDRGDPPSPPSYADGVVLETHSHGVYPGDPRLEPVFAELNRRRAVVFVHPTSPVCWEQSAPRPAAPHGGVRLRHRPLRRGPAVRRDARTPSDLKVIVAPLRRGAARPRRPDQRVHAACSARRGRGTGTPSHSSAGSTTTRRARPSPTGGPPCSAWPTRTGCCTAATTAGHRPRRPRRTPRPSTPRPPRLRAPAGAR
ncbi:hypothetical protein LT493_44025 [Streptomyces tricolor]|nr:hypothetical protein [Streptomyces tricolor]